MTKLLNGFFRFDTPPREDNRLNWQVHTEVDKRTMEAFFLGMKPAPMKDSEAVRDRLVLYPEMEAGLEIECGTGRRIMHGRNRLINIFGVDEQKHEEDWEENGVFQYCQCASYDKLPYPDSIFDWVIVGKPISASVEMLKEIKRVSNNHGYFFFKDDGIDYLHHLIWLGFFPRIYTFNPDGSTIEGEWLRGSL